MTTATEKRCPAPSSKAGSHTKQGRLPTDTPRYSSSPWCKFLNESQLGEPDEDMAQPPRPCVGHPQRFENGSAKRMSPLDPDVALRRILRLALAPGGWIHNEVPNQRPTQFNNNREFP